MSFRPAIAAQVVDPPGEGVGQAQLADHKHYTALEVFMSFLVFGDACGESGVRHLARDDMAARSVQRSSSEVITPAPRREADHRRQLYRQ